MFELRNRRARKPGLENIELFSRCTERQLRKITVLMTDLRVPAGRVLARAGEPGEEYFVIVSGSARVVRQGATVDILGPGSHYGDVSLLDGGPRIDTVVADTDMELLVLSRSEFSSDDFLVPSVTRKILAELAARLRRTVEGTAGEGRQDDFSSEVDVGSPEPSPQPAPLANRQVRELVSAGQEVVTE
jgi:CRP/FNR family cyclic AMP-dependent transcriptional regulator